jgi:hypothetical protein
MSMLQSKFPGLSSTTCSHQVVLCWDTLATAVLVEALLQRGGGRDLEEAQAATDRLARPYRPTPGSYSTRYLCCACVRCWREHMGMRRSIEIIETVTARWRHRLASKGIWCWPRR